VIRPDENPSNPDPDAGAAAPIAKARTTVREADVQPAGETTPRIDEMPVPPLTDEEDTMGG
jgi:hypothetical protein